MSKLSQIKLELAKLLASFSDIKTDKAIISYPEESEPYVGLEVYVLDENGEYIPAADDEYVMEDGKIIVVVDSKISEIREPAEEVVEEVVEEPVVEEIEAEEAPAEEEMPAVEEAPAEEPKPESEEEAIDEVHKEINELYEIVDRLIKKVEDLDAKVLGNDEKIERMSKMSAAMSAEIEINDPAPVRTGNTKLDEKLSKMFKK